EVEQFLTEEANSAFERSFNIIRTRVDKFGVTQPNVQRAGNNRIAVELPGIDDPERVRKLLQGSAKLEFWKTYENAEIINSLMAANNTLADVLKLNEGSGASAAVPAAENQDEQAEPGDTVGDTASADDALSLLEQIGSDSAAADTGDAALAD